MCTKKMILKQKYSRHIPYGIVQSFVRLIALTSCPTLITLLSYLYSFLLFLSEIFMGFSSEKYLCNLCLNDLDQKNNRTLPLYTNMWAQSPSKKAKGLAKLQ